MLCQLGAKELLISLSFGHALRPIMSNWADFKPKWNQYIPQHCPPFLVLKTDGSSHRCGACVVIRNRRLSVADIVGKACKAKSTVKISENNIVRRGLRTESRPSLQQRCHYRQQKWRRKEKNYRMVRKLRSKIEKDPPTQDSSAYPSTSSSISLVSPISASPPALTRKERLSPLSKTSDHQPLDVLEEETITSTKESPAGEISRKDSCILPDSEKKRISKKVCCSPDSGSFRRNHECGKECRNEIYQPTVEQSGHSSEITKGLPFNYTGSNWKSGSIAPSYYPMARRRMVFRQVCNPSVGPVRFLATWQCSDTRLPPGLYPLQMPRNAFRPAIIPPGRFGPLNPDPLLCHKNRFTDFQVKLPVVYAGNAMLFVKFLTHKSHCLLTLVLCSVLCVYLSNDQVRCDGTFNSLRFRFGFISVSK